METPTVSQALAGPTRREIGHRALEARDSAARILAES